MKRISLSDDWYVYPRDDAFSLVTAIPDDAVHTSVPYDALWHEGAASRQCQWRSYELL